ncbi:MAG: arylsulfatase [Gemmataceae bacterium]
MSFLFVSLWVGGGNPVAASEAAKPNVILIVADDLGTYELGCYGQKIIKTPNIDKLASRGMQFNRFYAGNAVCAPSRCCLLTGKHPGHATIRDNKEAKPEGQFPINADDTTLAEMLKKQGYVTGAVGKWGLGMFGSSGDPLKHGFDFFYGYNCQRHAHSHYPTYLYRNDKRFELPGNNLKTGDAYSHDLFEKESLQFIKDNKAKPFFLFVPFTVPHVAVQVPEDGLTQYKGKLGEDPAYDGKKGYQPHPAPHAGYAAMVSRMDRSVGRIVDLLKELKIDNNTLVIFTSDNGPTHNVGGADSTYFQSAGALRGLKGSLYEGGIRIPFIASWPGVIKPGTKSDSPFAFWDLYPTFAEIVGVNAPKGLDGVSFWPTLAGVGKQKEHELLYWEFPGYGGQQALIAGDWKVVRQQLAKGTIKTELYNLKEDMSEKNNVAKENPDVVARLEALMAREHVRSPVFPLQSVDAPVAKPVKP